LVRSGVGAPSLPAPCSINCGKKPTNLGRQRTLSDLQLLSYGLERKAGSIISIEHMLREGLDDARNRFG
jgi:hypothetical protein